MIDATAVIKFTGAKGEGVAEQARLALDAVLALVAAYTRDNHMRGGVLRPGVESVVLQAAARLMSNPEQVQVREQIGPYSYFRGDGFNGFTLAELAVLDRYRKRAI